MCSMYQRAGRRGAVRFMNGTWSTKRKRFYPSSDPLERFWSKVIKTDTCWEWQGKPDIGGYGIFVIRSYERIRAHRFSWELYNRCPVPDGMFVCHHCDNPRCVRPDHLFIGTNQDNLRDASVKGRLPRQVGKGNLTHCKRGHPFTSENTSRPPFKNHRIWGRAAHQAAVD